MTQDDIEPGKEVIMNTPTHRKEGKSKVLTGKFNSVKVEIIDRVTPLGRTASY